MRILSRRQVLELLSLHDCIAAVEDAFRRPCRGAHARPGRAGRSAPRAAASTSRRPDSSARAATSRPRRTPTFPDNPRRFGLPTIRGTVVLADAEHRRAARDDGFGERDGLADRRGHRRGREAPGATGRADRHGRGLRRPGRDPAGRDRRGAAAASAPGCSTPTRRAPRASPRAPGGPRASASTAATDLRAALRESDVCVTCTPSRARAGLPAPTSRPGTFIAAVGADSQGKQELEPALVASATLVVDVLEQCAEIGELQHALAAGLMTRDDVHAELADVVDRPAAGANPRRRDHDLRQLGHRAAGRRRRRRGLRQGAAPRGRGTEVTLDD